MSETQETIASRDGGEDTISSAASRPVHALTGGGHRQTQQNTSTNFFGVPCYIISIYSGRCETAEQGVVVFRRTLLQRLREVTTRRVANSATPVHATKADRRGDEVSSRGRRNSRLFNGKLYIHIRTCVPFMRIGEI